jgi:hypothetical protein
MLRKVCWPSSDHAAIYPRWYWTIFTFCEDYKLLRWLCNFFINPFIYYFVVRPQSLHTYLQAGHTVPSSWWCMVVENWQSKPHPSEYHVLHKSHKNWGGAEPVHLTKLNFVASVRERTIPTERQPLVDEVSVNFVVSVTDPYDGNLGFLDRSR